MTRSQLVFGLGFIALGTVLLLDRAGLADTSTIVGDWWPTIVILTGLTQMTMRPRNVAGGAFVAVMGAALLLWSLWGVDTVSLLWPLVLVALGLWLLTRRPTPKRDANVIADGEVLALFDDRVVRAPSGQLASRSLTTILGDLELDLRDATLSDDATLQVVTILGDVVLDIPDEWRVTVSGPQIFADVEVEAPAGPSTAGTAGRVGELHLDVVTIFGDVAVRRSSVMHHP